MMMSNAINILELRSVRGTGGGPEKTILMGATMSNPARFRVTVCYVRDARDTVFSLDTRASRLPIDYLEIRERHSLDPAILRPLRDLVRTRAFDIVHAHDYKTNLLALLLARMEPVIPVSTAHGWTGHSGRERCFYYPMDRWLLGHYPCVFAVSSQIRDTLISAGADPKRVVVVLNGIDPDAFRRDPSRTAEARRVLGLQPYDFALGAVGRLEPQKNFPMLIEAVAALRPRYPNLRLLIAGDGSQRPVLESAIETRGLTDTVRLLGHQGDVMFFHHALDLFVQSSDYEGTPNAVLEAMALETPIVATAAGGTAELALPNQHALIVPCRQGDALRDAILECLQQPEQTRARVHAARARVEGDLSFAARMRRVETIYHKLCERYPRGGERRRWSAHSDGNHAKLP